MTIDASQLRKLAETADGLRNQNLALIKRGNEHLVIPEEELVSEDEMLISLRTDDPVTRSDRPGFEIVLHVEGGPSVPVSTVADSMFWTLSAVDKFVIPYYSRIWPIQKVRAFRAKLAEDYQWLAMYHPPLSDVTVLLMTQSGFQSVSVDDYLASPQSQS
jgi:hypothetical protein